MARNSKLYKSLKNRKCTFLDWTVCLFVYRKKIHETWFFTYVIDLRILGSYGMCTIWKLREISKRVFMIEWVRIIGS